MSLKESIKEIVHVGATISFPYKKKLGDMISDIRFNYDPETEEYQVYGNWSAYEECNGSCDILHKDFDKVFKHFSELVLIPENLGLIYKRLRAKGLFDQLEAADMYLGHSGAQTEERQAYEDKICKLIKEEQKLMRAEDEH